MHIDGMWFKDDQGRTEIFVPNYQYPEGYAVELSDGTYRIDREAQTLTVQHAPDRETHTIRVWPAAS